MIESLPKHDVVLLGAGHTNAHIIRMWKMNPIPDARLTCVSDHLDATYSGMLTGTLAGQYDTERMKIDLVRLCAASNVRLVHGKVAGLDLQHQHLLLDDRPSIPFDALSIGIGSKPTVPCAADNGIVIKPMQTFLQRLREKLLDYPRTAAGGPLRIAIAGGGIAGVEIALCLAPFVAAVVGHDQLVEITIIERGNQLLAGMPARTQKLAAVELAKRGIDVQLNSTVETSAEDRLLLLNGLCLPADLIIWATSAVAHDLLGNLGLSVDEAGFLVTTNTLQSVDCDSVFVVGDSGSLQHGRTPKAGVYAVRQGPVLWENLQSYLAGKPLRSWLPQKKFLTLINTGDGRAIATYRGTSVHGRWCWKLKHRIDARFMAKYQDYRPRMPNAATLTSEQNESELMQCGGCGSKASASLLQLSLAKLSNPSSDHVVLGTNTPDDVAILKSFEDANIAASTDFFSAFVDDPYLLGRVAALNALSDLYAKGATPHAALSVAMLPKGPLKQQGQLLDDLLAGAAREFREPGVPIVGGHTIVSPKLTFGFTVLGSVDENRVVKKSSPQPGDALVLTKPLGIGVLLAAHMRAACRSEWWEPLLAALLQSNYQASMAANEVGVTAATDVTGFGLAGHLLEMLTPLGLSAEVSLGSLPTLPGAVELVRQGIESSLAPANRESFTSVTAPKHLGEQPEYHLLFDPQTSGGLLLAVNPQHARDLMTACGPAAVQIGQVLPSDNGKSSIRILD